MNMFDRRGCDLDVAARDVLAVLARTTRPPDPDPYDPTNTTASVQSTTTPDRQGSEGS